MNDRDILKALKEYDKAELVYLDAKRMRDGEITRKELIKKHSDNQFILDLALHPFEDFGTIEEDYISGSRHTLISKHPRLCTVGMHTHSFFEMIYVMEGSCKQYFENNSFDLKIGDFCILSPETAHYIFDDSGAIVIDILIRQSSFMEIFSDMTEENSEIARFFSDNLYAKKKLSFMLFHTGKDPEIRSNILHMYKEELCPDSYSDSIILHLIRINFALLMRSHTGSMEIPRLQKTGNELSGDIISYIYNNYATATLENIAEHFNFSRQYCSKLIIELTGMPLSELRTNIRMRHGTDMLLNTAMSIEDISLKLGYENTETFIRAFKRTQNITPGAFRRQNRDQSDTSLSSL